MKPNKVLIALPLALAVVVMAQETQIKPPAAEGPPKLVIAATTHDFGEVSAGTVLKHSFTLKNQGKGDLLIKSVTPG
jgi:hypothetical protein